MDTFEDDSGIEWKNNVTQNDNRVILYGNRSITSWYYPAWSDRCEIYIRNPSGGYLSGYQVDLTIPFLQGMQPDFDDLRFTRYDNLNGTEEPLPYWIESRDTGVSAIVWINVTGIHPHGDTTLFVYYGNQAVSSESSGEATFAFFDDFSGTGLNTSKWELPLSDGLRDYSVSGGQLLLEVFNAWSVSQSCLKRTPMALDGRMIEARQRMEKGGGKMGNALAGTLGIYMRDSSVSWRRYYGRSSKENVWLKYTTSNSQGDTLWSQGAWNGGITPYHVLGLAKEGDDIRLYEDLIFKAAIQDSGITEDLYYVGILNLVSGYSGSGFADLWTDWIRIRNHVTPEPVTRIIPLHGTLHSKIITLPDGMEWDMLSLNKSEPIDTHLTISVINADTNATIAGFHDLAARNVDLSGLNGLGVTEIRLGASFEGMRDSTPALNSWGVEWTAVNAWRDSFIGEGKLTKAENVTIESGKVEMIDWWDHDWDYRRTVSVYNMGVDLADHQVRVDLTPENFNLTRARPNGEDIRFVDGNGAELNYWIESWNVNGECTLWVNVTNVPGGLSKIHMYYGNPVAPSKSSGDLTFDFFDDFSGIALDTGKWHSRSQGSTSKNVQNGFIRLYSDSGGVDNVNRQHITGKTTFLPGIRMDYIYRQEDSRYYGRCALATDFNSTHAQYPKGDHISHGVRGGYNTRSYYAISVNGTSQHSENILDENPNQWYSASIIFDSGHQELIRDGSSLSQSQVSLPQVRFFPFFSEVSPWNSNYHLDIDLVRVRKYAAEEPDISLGKEQSPTHCHILSEPIDLSAESTWNCLKLTGITPQNTHINVTIIDNRTGDPIPGFSGLAGMEIDLLDMNSMIFDSICLKADFEGGTESPILYDWAVNWTRVEMPEFTVEIDDVDILEDMPTGDIVDLSGHFTDIYSRVRSPNYSIEKVSDAHNVTFAINDSHLDITDLSDNWTGNVSLNVKCTNIYGYSASSNTFVIRVVNVNDLPVWSTRPPTIILDEDGNFTTGYSLREHVFDCDSDGLEFSVISPNENLTAELDENGHVTVFPARDYFGETNISAEVRDEYSNGTCISIPVIVRSINDPPTVELMFPVNGTILTDMNVTLSWNGSDADNDYSDLSYDLYLGEDVSPTLYMSDIRDTFITLNDLDDGSVYHWYVVANDGNDCGECRSGIWNFTIDTDIPVPEVLLVSPEDGSFTNENDVKLDWQGSNPTGEEVMYHVLIGNSSHNLVDIISTADTHFSLSNLEEKVTYYWTIIPYTDTLRGRCGSGIWSFTIDSSFEPVHSLNITFERGKIEIYQGEKATINITLENTGNVPLLVELACAGELVNYTDIPKNVSISWGETIKIPLEVAIPLNVETGPYLLKLLVDHPGASEQWEILVTVKETEPQDLADEPERSMFEKPWFWAIIITILVLALGGISVFFVIFMRARSRKEPQKGDAGLISAEIEHVPGSGFTKESEIELISRNIATPGAEADAPMVKSGTLPFEGRLSFPPGRDELKYTLPGEVERPTLPPITGETGEMRALPQVSAVSPTDLPEPEPEKLSGGPEGIGTLTLPPGPEIPVAVARPISQTTLQDPTPVAGSQLPIQDTPVVVSKPVPQAPPREMTTRADLPGPPPEALPAPSLVSELFPNTARSEARPVPPLEHLPPPEEDTPMFPSIKSPAAGTKTSYLSVKNATTFRIEEPMPCSLCHGEISSGLLAARCSCGNICHLSCGIKLGRCQDCATDYGDMMNTVNQDSIIASVVDSRKTAKREVESKVEWDEKDDMMKKLLKRVLNGEISIDEYKMLAADIKETF